MTKKTISEISKQKAYDYISHASIDKSFQAMDVERANHDGSRRTAAGRAEQDKASKTHGRRSWGIQVAASKLAGAKGLNKAFKSKVPATEETDMNETAEFNNPTGHTKPTVVDALGKTTTDGLGKGVILESVINEDAVALSDAVDAILRAKIDEALFGAAEEETEESED
jgi:hypothetical protein